MDELEQILTNYKPSEEALKLIRETPILFLVGPTGVGKDAIKQELLKRGEYHHIVSHTTRHPRENRGVLEQDGREYHFVDMEKVKQMLREHAFIEANFYSGNMYGTCVAEIQIAKDEHKIAVTDLEVQGVAEYKAMAPQVMAAFILPPSFDVWQDRLHKRYGDVIDKADFTRRMQTAAHELEQLLAVDYYIPVVNDDLEASVELIDHMAHGGIYDVSQKEKALQAAEKLHEKILFYLHTSEMSSN